MADQHHIDTFITIELRMIDLPEPDPKLSPARPHVIFWLRKESFMKFTKSSSLTPNAFFFANAQDKYLNKG